MRISFTFKLIMLSAFVLAGSVVAAHASAIEACKLRVASVAADAATTAVNRHYARIPHVTSRKISGNKIVEVITPPGDVGGHSHDDVARAANAVLREAGFRDVDATGAVKAALEQSYARYKAWREGFPKRFSRKEAEAIVKSYNKFRPEQTRQWVQDIANGIEEAIIPSYCTNNPSDCYGVLDIDPRTGIVYNETTGRNVDLSVCRTSGLAGSNLANRNLRGVNLAGANLRGTDFRGANLAESNLAGADLQGANLSRTNMVNATLAGANLAASNLSGAIMERANLAAANFKDAILEKANLSNSNLGGAILDGANLSKTVFTNAMLGAASLKGAILQGARFIGARITFAQLSAANWAGAIVEAVHAKALNDLDTGWKAFIEEGNQ